MKYNIAMILLVLLGTVVIADGYIRSSHDKQNLLRVRTTVSAMSPQKLAAGISNCDPVRSSGEHPKYKSTLCSEISRALDEQQLELVVVRPFMLRLPQSLPPLKFRKPEIAPPAPPDYQSEQVVVFDVAKAG